MHSYSVYHGSRRSVNPCPLQKSFRDGRQTVPETDILLFFYTIGVSIIAVTALSKDTTAALKVSLLIAVPAALFLSPPAT